MHTQQIIDEAQDIAKYVQMINNQVQQINTLTSQLTEFKNYEAVFGNPSKVVLSRVTPLKADLQKLEPGQNLETLVSSANGSSALTYNNSGLYTTIGTSFQTPGGATIQRPADQYKPYAAINGTAYNYVAVADDAAQRRTEIKTEIAQTHPEQLQDATTDAEVQKLHGVLTSLNADLTSTDDEVNQAATRQQWCRTSRTGMTSRNKFRRLTEQQNRRVQRINQKLFRDISIA